jgi:hypothetical protein
VHHCTYAHAHTVADLGTKLQTNGAANNDTVFVSDRPITKRAPHGSPNNNTDAAAHRAPHSQPISRTDTAAHRASLGAPNNNTNIVAYRAPHCAPNKRANNAAHRAPHRPTIVQPICTSDDTTFCDSAHVHANPRDVRWILRWGWVQRCVLLLG